MTALRRLFLPATLSGVLLWLAFYPVNAGPVALFALAPFLTLVRAESARRWPRYLAAFAGGFVFSALAIKWVAVAHPMMALFTWPAGSVYCALYWPVALYLLRRVDRAGLPFSVTLPAVWVLLEYVRTHFPTGFPFLQPLGLFQLVGFNWYALGYALHDFLPAVQAADLGGVYLVSLMVASVNGVMYEWLVRSKRVRQLFRWPPLPERRGLVWEAYRTAWGAIFPVLVVCYGTVRLVHPAYGVGPRIAAVQGNIPQNEKMDRDVAPGEVTPLQKAYFRLARQAAMPDGDARPPDLVIWPETCFPVEWCDVAPEITGAANEAEVRDGVRNAQGFVTNAKLALLPRAFHLVGVNRLEVLDVRGDGDMRKYNAAVLFTPDRRAAGSYDKMHLVPFGEYVPFRSKFLANFTPYTHDYSCTPGDRLTRFEVPAAGRDGKGREVFSFGVLICYEDTDPYLARQYNPASGRTPGVDFLVNISNDGWFAGTEEHAQHLAICQFRAVEARRSVVRAVNTGISAVIDPDGRIIALPNGESLRASAGVEAIVRAEVPIGSDTTIYAAVGDWVPLACLLVYLGLRVWPGIGPRLIDAVVRRVRVAADVSADRR